MFTIRFKAKSSGRLSNILDVTSEMAAAQAYDASYEVFDLGLRYESVVTAGGFELKQNRPNPFAHSTNIGFVLPERSAVTLTFFDVTGKMVHRVNGQYDRGEHVVTLTRDDLQVQGVVYYTLETDTHTETKRAVILR